MTTTINASTSSGLVNTADTSGIIKLQSNGVTTNALAWVNFNGTGTVAIRSSYNVSSITDNGTGDYTVNFTTALSDVNYVIVGATINNGQMGVQIAGTYNGSPTTYTTSAVRINTTQANTYYDCTIVNVAIFGN